MFTTHANHLNRFIRSFFPSNSKQIDQISEVKNATFHYVTHAVNKINSRDSSPLEVELK